MGETIGIVLPVYNEERLLEKNTIKIMKYCDKQKYNYTIIIGDNASTDKTQKIGKTLEKKYDKVSYIRINKKGRGHILRKIWSQSKFNILMYMDIDLATDLNHINDLIKELQNGNDIVTGSRLMDASKIKRSLHREILSKGYNFLIKLLFNNKIQDYQCGFKAIKSDVAKKIIPKIENNYWFFDTELLILAEINGYKVKEIPVKWTEDRVSTVRVFKDVIDYLYQILKFKIRLIKQ